MEIIFLDIDGVLNCDDTPNPRKFPYIVDPRLLSILEDLLARTGAKVVLSSSWRTDPVGLLAARFYGVPFTDVCPDLPGVSRCEEMLRWLSAHQGVHRYVVIDDESDCLDDLRFFNQAGRRASPLRSRTALRSISVAKPIKRCASLPWSASGRTFTPCSSGTRVSLGC
jgi:hypothetical protein